MPPTANVISTSVIPCAPLLRLRVVPVINENDTVAFEEIRFGDNDTLGAGGQPGAEAELYVILTDQQGAVTIATRASSRRLCLISEGRAGDGAGIHGRWRSGQSGAAAC